LQIHQHYYKKSKLTNT